MNKLVKRFISLCLLGVLAFAAAQDGLYAPEPPANSAFVRVANALSSGSAFSSQLGSAGFSELGFGGVSSYQVVPEGSYDFAAAGSSASLSISAGNFYTVAVIDNGSGAHIVLLKDPSNSNMAKSLLVLYNLSGLATTHMKTADGAQAVISDVGSDTLGSIVVNPISVELAAFSDASIAAFPAELERGAAYSLFVMGSAGSPSAYWIPSVTQ
ncbi:MAG: alginate O-acetyltransferase AlgF [Trueperaceae bacterium]|nr:alginate O-acetyltransferase AlgF [Trueperaceae bacterium]